MENITQAKLAVRQWSERHRHVVLYDEVNGVLLDVASGKRLQLPWLDVIGFEKKIHPETGDRYLVLLFESGKQIVLADPGGIAFAPSVENSGPIPNLPEAVCLRDFLTLKQRVDHYLYDHPDEEPPPECLDAIMICIATLDGARAVGFDIGDLERELETALNEIERRAE